MDSPLITTDRVIIRKFNLDDAEFIYQLLNSEAWINYIGNRNIQNLEDARNYIANSPLYFYQKFGFGPYLVALKDTQEPIGMCSLIKRDTLNDVDLGFAFLDPFIGRGYAYEASKAVIEFSEKTLALKKLLAITLPYNIASIKLLEKLGFRYQNNIQFPNETEELMLFSLTLNP